MTFLRPIVFWDFHLSGFQVHIMDREWDCFGTKLPSDPDQNRIESAQV